MIVIKTTYFWFIYTRRFMRKQIWRMKAANVLTSLTRGEIFSILNVLNLTNGSGWGGHALEVGR